MKSKIILPPIAEQRRIAEILAMQDGVIELKEKLLAEKQRQKKYLMQQLLTGKKRLPGFEGEWSTEKLSGFCKFIGGGTPDTKNDQYWQGDIPWISSSDLSIDDFTSITITRYISSRAVSDSATKVCPAGCLLLVNRVGVGKIAIAPCDLCTSQDFINIVQHKHDNHYLIYALNYFVRHKLSQVQGSAIKGIPANEIKEYSIPFPSKREQIAISHILEKADQEIKLLKQCIQLEKKQKKVLTRLLLTGLVRSCSTMG